MLQKRFHGRAQHLQIEAQSHEDAIVAEYPMYRFRTFIAEEGFQITVPALISFKRRLIFGVRRPIMKQWVVVFDLLRQPRESIIVPRPHRMIDLDPKSGIDPALLR